MSKPEQICDRYIGRPRSKTQRRKMHYAVVGGRIYRAFLKREAKRLMRRFGRKLLDDAPTKVPFRGWEY